MTDAPLTQEEIQALFASAAAAPDIGGLAELEEQLAAVYGEVAAQLNEAGVAVTVGRPEVQKRTTAEVGPALPAPEQIVCTAFAGGANGAAALAVDADAMASLGEAVSLTTLGDGLFAALASRLASVLGSEVTVAPVKAATAGTGPDALSAAGFGADLVQAFTPLAVNGDVAGSWLLLLDGALASAFASGQAAATAAAAVASAPAAPAQPVRAAEAAAAEPVTTPAAAPVAVAAAPAPVQPSAAVQPRPATAPAATRGPVPVQPAAFGDIGRASDSGNAHNIDLLLDVPLQITVELGRTRRPIKDVLALGPGSIVELDRLAGEPVDVYANGQLVARGEVVVIDENFGVRVTDIISPTDRVRSLE